jgi:hypothetical protein
LRRKAEASSDKKSSFLSAGIFQADLMPDGETDIFARICPIWAQFDPVLTALSGKLAVWTGNIVVIPMNPGPKFRLGTRVTAIVLDARTAWWCIGKLQVRLITVQLKTFRTASYFRDSLLCYQTQVGHGTT